VRTALLAAPQGPELQATIPTRWILVALLAAPLLGAAVARAPVLTLLALATPFLLTFVVGRPEWVLLLFLTAGIYKNDPRITTALPCDVTVLMGSLLILTLVMHIVRKPIRISGQVLLLVPMVLMVLRGVLGGASDYGEEKAMRFCTLTLLALVGSNVLLADKQGIERFLAGIVVLGCFLCIDSISQHTITSEGRLTAHGSNPISLARIGAFTLAFGWVRLHLARQAAMKLLAIGILGLGCWCLIATGSRGPVVSTVMSMSVISIVTTRWHGRSPIGLSTVMLLGGLAALVLSLAAIPQLPLQRFALLFSDDKGTSILLRAMLMAAAFNLMLANPLGLGVGGFARHAVLDLKYPHNLFLEVGSELGWIPLICLMILMVWSFKAMYDILTAEYSWTALFLGVVVLSASMNAMVTGDLNDNRMLFAVIFLPFLYRKALQTGGVGRLAVAAGRSLRRAAARGGAAGTGR
jgi:hypothetical protein